MQIKEVEQLAGIKKANIRYYEDAGLLKPKRNEANHYRIYSQEDVLLLKKIKFLRALGISVQEIKSLQEGEVPLSALMDRRQQEIRRTIIQMESLEKPCRLIKEQGYTFWNMNLSVLDLPDEQMHKRQKNVIRADKIYNLERYDKITARFLESLGGFYLLFSVWIRAFAGMAVPLWITIPTVVLAGVTVAFKYFIIKRISYYRLKSGNLSCKKSGIKKPKK